MLAVVVAALSLASLACLALFWNSWRTQRLAEKNRQAQALMNDMVATAKAIRASHVSKPDHKMPPKEEDR
jgi:hypothetical protein